MKKILVVLAEGFEEVEAVTPVDYLRRAGIEVTVAGLTGKMVKGARGMTLVADCELSEVRGGFDGILLPGGGPGSKALAASAIATELIRKYAEEGKLVAAICAAPALVLGKAAGILKGRRFTCFPGLENEFTGGLFQAARVVSDGNIITSRSAGTAGEFSKEIIRYFLGAETANSIAEQVLLEP